MNLIASALLNPELNDEQRRGKIRDMQRRLDRIDWLISALLKIARLDAGNISLYQEQIPFKQLIDKAAQPLTIPMELKGQVLKQEVSAAYGLPAAAQPQNPAGSAPESAAKRQCGNDLCSIQRSIRRYAGCEVK